MANLSAGSSGGGQTLYDCIVASSGGDFTTLGAAITAGNTTIFIREGTYSESAITTSVASLTIIGANPETTVLTFAGNSFSASGAFMHLENVKMTFTTGVASFTGDDLEVINCHVSKTGSGAQTYGATDRAFVRGCRFVSTQTDAGQRINFQSAFSRIIGNHFQYTASAGAGGGTIQMNAANSVYAGNTFDYSSGTGTLLLVGGANSTFSDNVLDGGATNGANPVVYSTVNAFTGNVVAGGALAAVFDGTETVTGNTFIAQPDGVQIDQPNTLFAGNFLRGDNTTAGFVGIDVIAANDEVSIQGNYLHTYATGINIGASTNDRCLIVGNYIDNGVTTPLVDAGTGTRSDIPLAGTPAGQGFSSTTSDVLRYSREGNIVTCEFNIQGTSNATTFTFTLPFTAKTSIERSGFCGLDNTSRTGVDPRIDLAATSATATVYKDLTGAAWTGSGTKAVNGCLVYECE